MNLLLKITSLLFFALIAVSARAETGAVTSCKQGATERKVSVMYADAGKKAPCEVKYLKDGEEKTIFSAKAEEGFCEKKAEEFIGKLKGLGFTCEAATK